MSRPIVAVLCHEGHRPPGMEAVEAAAEVRYTSADGLPAAPQGAQVLFLWDFFSTALQDA